MYITDRISIFHFFYELAKASLNPFRYRGYYYDTDTGFYYLNSRYYDPATGRFINADSQLNDGLLGFNLFAYCENNPVNRVDPNGTSERVAPTADDSIKELLMALLFGAAAATIILGIKKVSKSFDRSSFKIKIKVKEKETEKESLDNNKASYWAAELVNVGHGIKQVKVYPIPLSFEEACYRVVALQAEQSA